MYTNLSKQQIKENTLAEIIEEKSLRTQRFYPPLRGVNYIQYLKRMHIFLKPDWYFEVGSFTGESLEVSRSKTIAVDPSFRLSAESIKGKPQLHLFQMTSDDYFDSDVSRTLAGTINMAFLDGMHQFEFLLRDFMATEQRSAKDSVIAMHDCIPISSIAAERIRQSGVWTGDVWKLIPILKAYRPDLQIDVVDCPPSGLTIIQNLDPENSILAENYTKIVDDYIDQSVEGFGADKLLKLLNIQSSVDKFVLEPND